MYKPLALTVIAALASCALQAQTTAEQEAVVPVMLYPDTDHGTCSYGLQVNAGGAALRAGPGAKFPIVAMLDAGHVVSGCDEQGDWDGVIDGQDETCSVGIEVAKTRPYEGPCPSGWIERSSLTQIYG
jgi:hypothetical protein